MSGSAAGGSSRIGAEAVASAGAGSATPLRESGFAAGAAGMVGSPLRLANSAAESVERLQPGLLPPPITTSRTRLLNGGFRGSPRPSRSSSCTALLPRLKPFSQRGVWRSTRKLSPFTLTRSRQRASSSRRCCRGASSSSQSISTGSSCCRPSGLAAISWAEPRAGSSAALRPTRCRRIWLTAPGDFTASPHGRAAYTVSRWLPGSSGSIVSSAAVVELLMRRGGC